MKTAILTLFLLMLTSCVPRNVKPPTSDRMPEQAEVAISGGVVTLYSNTGEVLHQWTGVDRVWATASGINFTLIGDNTRYLVGGTYSVTPAP